MELSDHLHGFVFDNLNKWKIGAVNPYSGTKALSHSGEVKNWIQGDNVVLNRVYLPAGKYQFSFFWHTLQNQTGEYYNHTFDVMIGTSPDALTMTRKIMGIVNESAPEKAARKEMAELTIDKDGYYWVAFKLLQAGSMGNISIDNVRIESPEATVSLLDGNAAYTADFALRGDEWQHYHPLRMQTQQWDEVTESGATYLEAKEFTATKSPTTQATSRPPRLLWLPVRNMSLKSTMRFCRSMQTIPSPEKSASPSIARHATSRRSLCRLAAARPTKRRR